MGKKVSKGTIYSFQIGIHNMSPSRDESKNRITANTMPGGILAEKEEQEKFLSILHLSDIHLGNQGEADKYRVQLETDLKNELKTTRLDYLVITGDIGTKSEPSEYQAAWSMTSTLMDHFGLDSKSVVIVPGNHDLNFL